MTVNSPIWLTRKEKQSFPRLTAPVNADVAIVGAGIAGVTTAYLLSKQGLKVTLLEKNLVSTGATSYTTAMITGYVDTNISDLIRIYGLQKTKLIVNSHMEAIDSIEKIVKKEKINCNFMRVPYYIYSPDGDTGFLENEHSALKKIGIKAKLQSGKLILENQAKFHPLKYVSAMAKIAAKNDVQIYEKSKVKSLKDLNAKYVVIATHLPINRPLELFFKKTKYKTYMIYAKLPKGKIKEALYQDTLTPYHYFRVDAHKNFDTVLLGGQDHRADIPISKDKNYQSLENYLYTHISEKYEISARWSGPIIETIDGLAYIGPLRGNKNILYATGFSGNGMTYGTLAGEILSSYILGKDNKYFSIYSAQRMPTLPALLQKGKDYTKIFLSSFFSFSSK